MTDWTQLCRLFNEVLEAPTANREAILDAACGDDDRLANEVRGLMAHYEGSEDFLEDSAVLQDNPLEPEPGSTFGAYRVEGVVGRGGMGIVMTAQRSDAQFDKLVAIKLLSSWPTPALVERFRLERQILATLEHPNITRLLDGGVAEDGRPFLVMEHVAGAVPIDEYAKDLPLQRRLELFVAACEAVAYAHSHLVVHRDLKATNVVVSSDGTVKLLDFGIAERLGAGNVAQAAAMSAVCASPEQVRGETVTTGTDVYGLGVLLYRILTGVFPHDIEGLSSGEVVRVICEEPAPLASTRGDRRLAGDLDAIVDKALRKDPAERYGSVATLREDIRRHLERRPISLRDGSAAYVMARFVRRHATATIALAVSVVALFAGTGVAVWQGQLARAQRDRARAAVLQSNRVSQFLVELFESANALESANAANVPVSALLDRGEQHLAALDEAPEIQTRMLHVLGRVNASAGRLTHARDLLIRALDQQQDLVDPPARALANLQFDLGRIHLLLGERALAADHANESLRQRTALLGEQHPRVGASKILVCRIGHELGADDALQYCRGGLQLLRGRLKPDDRRLAKAVRQVANALHEHGRNAEALPLYEEALATFVGHDAKHYEVAATRDGLAAVLAALGDDAGAAREASAALEIKTSWLPEGHPLLVPSLTEKGAAAFRQADYRTALERWRSALRIQKRTLGERHVDVALLASRVGTALAELGELTEARRVTSEALATVLEEAGESHPHVAIIRGRLDALAPEEEGPTTGPP